MLNMVPGSGDPKIAAAGDIACDPASGNFNGGAGTAARAGSGRFHPDLGQGFSAVLPLGDNQYYCGGLSDFQQSYDLSWGRLLSATHPVVGNHEYVPSGGTGCDARRASGYFSYFGSRAGTTGQGYYSYDVGSWHLIALNSNCSNAGGCRPRSRREVAGGRPRGAPRTPARWPTGISRSSARAVAPPATRMPFWTALYNAGADVDPERPRPHLRAVRTADPEAARDDARGLREFIVGTGGANHTAARHASPRTARCGTRTPSGS